MKIANKNLACLRQIFKPRSALLGFLLLFPKIFQRTFECEKDEITSFLNVTWTQLQLERAKFRALFPTNHKCYNGKVPKQAKLINSI